MTMITTTLGLMDETLLTKVEGGVDNDHECTTWVEYYYLDALVHRSAHVTIKEGISAELTGGQIG